MAFTLVQTGTTLRLVGPDGTAAPLTLPTGVTLSAALTPRFAIFGGYVVMVNSPSRPITIDGTGTVRVLTPDPPGSALTLSGVTAGGLTGTYTARQTYRVRDASGNLISESDYGPVSAAVTIAAKKLRASGINLSSQDITETQLYRTTTLGATYFPWLTVSGNTQTAAEDDLSDAGLGILQGAPLGTAPDLTRICSWKSRLWGVDRKLIDSLQYTETGKMYAWSSEIDLPAVGADARGLVGFLPRRDTLGIGKANMLLALTGTTSDDIRLTILSNMLGVESQESAIVYRDTAYFLWQDGVYQWDAAGITCISDGVAGKGNVRSWFTTNSYFNRRQFSASFAMIDPIENKYRLFLCSAGSSVVDRWVEFDLQNRTWWGPHKTAAFSPQCAFLRITNNAIFVPTIGDTAGFLWQKQATRTDGASAIDFSVTTKRHDQLSPRIDKFWGRVSVAQVAQAAGTLTVTPAVGEMNAVTGTAMSADMTLPVQDLGRLGVGKTAQLNFENAQVGQDVELLGYEIDPINPVGKRL